MAGMQFAVVELEGKAIPTAAKFSGGGDFPITRDIASALEGGTNRKEPTGGREREDITIDFLERVDEGLLIDDLYATCIAWQNEPDPTKRRKPLALGFYTDKDFKTLVGKRKSWTGCWCYKVSALEFDTSSSDARKFSITVSHLGAS
jgi:hypothetical protein